MSHYTLLFDIGLQVNCLCSAADARIKDRKQRGNITKITKTME